MTDREFTSLSERARSLLRGEEGYDVEFKEALSGLHSGDLVAFANSPTGGTLLIGVREYENDDGRQRGRIIGCPVGDEEKLSIVNRAESCIPSVELEIFVENADRRPFFRIEIPSGRDKPYCTGGGTYKIRGNARTNALTPSRLLHLFMENESQAFLERFHKATVKLEANLAEMDARFTKELENMYANLIELERVLERTMGSATRAESMTDHSNALLRDMQSTVVELSRRMAKMEEERFPVLMEKVDGLLERKDREDDD